MPIRKRRHMAVFKGVMMAHAPVLTDATTSGGWIGWMIAKMSPATKAAKPLQRIRLEDVTFILLFSLRRLCSGHLRSRVCLLPSVQQKSTLTSAEARDFFEHAGYPVRELTYPDSCSKRAIADGLNPLTIGHMPSNNSHKNSGMTPTCHTPPSSRTPNSTATPVTMISGPPMSPSTAMPRGTSLEVYIK